MRSPAIRFIRLPFIPLLLKAIGIEKGSGMNGRGKKAETGVAHEFA
jgi:hypothetical protein